MPEAPRHSVVVPVYNEAAVLEAFHARCSAALRQLGEGCEILYVDDGSTDSSWEVLRLLAGSDPCVRLLRLSRNFGHQVAISAGIEYAQGDTVTTLDADLQDQPELIPAMVEAWRQGADVVLAVRQGRRGEVWFKRVSASAFYRLINGVADVRLQPESGDFRLLSRRVVQALVAMPERHRLVRGMVAWIGYPTATVGHLRDARAAGNSKYSLPRMVALALDGLVAFSNRPLRLATWLGLLVTASACVGALGLVWTVVAGSGAPAQAWSSLVVLILLLAGVQLLTVGVLGEYVGRIYDEVRRRPLYLVREVQGFDEPSPAAGQGPHGA